MINTGDRYTVLMSTRTQQELITRHGKSTLLCDYSNLVSSDASSHESLKLEIVPQDPKEPTELRSRRIRARRVESFKGFKHKSNQRRAQKNQSSARFIETCSQASENDAKPRKSQQNFFNSW